MPYPFRPPPISSVTSLANVINVMDTRFGAKGDGTSDDTAAIQSAINSSLPGDIIYWPAPLVAYLISAWLIFKPGRVYRGADRWESIMIAKAGTTLTWMGVSEGWYNNNTVVDAPIVIERLGFNGNNANSAVTGGVLMMNWRSRVDKCLFSTTTSDGVRFTNQNRAGTVISSSAVENRVTDSWFDNIASTGDCIRIHDPSGSAKITDGYIEGNILYGGNNAVNMDVSAGWNIENNHSYAQWKSSLVIQKMFSTRVFNNQVETYGKEHSAGGFYTGINCGVIAGWPSIVSNNTVVSEAGAAGTFKGIGIFAQVSTSGEVIVVGNAVQGNNLTGEIGYAFEYQSGGTLGVTLGVNRVSNVPTPRYVQGVGVVFNGSLAMGELLLDSSAAANFSRVALSRGGVPRWYLQDDASNSFYIQDGATSNMIEVVPAASMAANDTPMTVLIKVGASYFARKVVIGAVDSGGAGYRLLRIAN